MLFRQLFDQDTWTYTYLLADEETRQAIIIDPVLERVDRDVQLLSELGLELLYALDTHVHADHITGSGELRRRLGTLSAVSEVANVECADRRLIHGDTITFGKYTLQARSTPGHTDGCMTFVVETDEKTMAFTGDALFIRGTGRTDFQQGDSGTLYDSIHRQIFSLPDNAVIYPGHDYRGHQTSTVGEEKAHNPRVKVGTTRDAFIEIMNNLKLGHPKKIHEALPANMSCGVVHRDIEEEDDFQQLDVSALEAFPNALIVDVRSDDEYNGELGHLPNARLAPLPELRRLAENWERHQPVLVVCRSGRRSQLGCSILSELGFSHVANLKGGMKALREFEGRGH